MLPYHGIDPCEECFPLLDKHEEDQTVDQGANYAKCRGHQPVGASLVTWVVSWTI